MTRVNTTGRTTVTTRRRSTFESLRVRNYRLFFGGNIIGQTGTWANRVAQDWLVLQLTGNDPVALGIATALQFGPTLVLSLWGGILADRYDKRRMLMGIQAVIGLSVLTLGVLTVTDVVSVLQVYLICLVAGFASALDGPVRQAFVSEIVGPSLLPNAVGLNAMAFNSARIVGPSLAGLGIAAFGTGPVMIASGFGFIAVIVGLNLMRTAQLQPSRPVVRAKGQVREGLRYVAGRADLVMILVLLFIVATFGMNFQITLAISAKIVFDRDAASYGLLTTCLAIGALIGATLSARRQGAPRQRLVIGAALAFGLLEMSLGFVTSYAWLAVLLVPQGMFMLLFVNAANASVQLSTAATMRGRVMGLYTLIFLGGTPFVAPLVGVLAERAGGGAPLVVGGAVSALGALIVGIWLSRRHHVRLQIRSGPMPHLHLDNPATVNDDHGWADLAHGLRHLGGSAPHRAQRRRRRRVIAATTGLDRARSSPADLAGAGSARIDRPADHG